MSDYDKIIRWCRGLAERQVTASGSRATFTSDMYFDAADAIERLKAELEEAREIIGMLLNPPSPNSPEPHAYAKYADMTFRARAFLDKAGK